MTSTAPNSPALRKAAILVSTLDTRSADRLLDKMPPQTAAAVRQMVMDLDDVSPAEQNDVIREFMRAGGQTSEQEHAGSEHDGVELDPSLAEKLHAPTSFGEDHSAPPPQKTPQPFHFLRDATTEVLARHLDRQRPQLIAMVVSHLLPRQAANVIKLFAPKLQADVLRRVAELDVADREVLRDVERELESLLRDDLRLARNRQQGLATVSTILNAAGNERHTLLESLSAHHHDLAAELRGTSGSGSQSSPLDESQRPLERRHALGSATSVPVPPRAAPRNAEHSASADSPQAASRAAETKHPASHTIDNEAGEVVPAARATASEPGHTRTPPGTSFAREPGPELAFEELARLADDDWAVLLRAVEPQVVLLALTGASENLLRSMTQRMSKREAQTLRKRLQQTGPLRLSDIEQAQRQLAEQARRLAAAGKIRLPSRRSFAAAA